MDDDINAFNTILKNSGKDPEGKPTNLAGLVTLGLSGEQEIWRLDVPTMVICIPDKDNQHMETLEEVEYIEEEFYDCTDKDNE